MPRKSPFFFPPLFFLSLTVFLSLLSLFDFSFSSIFFLSSLSPPFQSIELQKWGSFPLFSSILSLPHTCLICIFFLNFFSFLFFLLIGLLSSLFFSLVLSHRIILCLAHTNCFLIFIFLFFIIPFDFLSFISPFDTWLNVSLSHKCTTWLMPCVTLHLVSRKT